MADEELSFNCAFAKAVRAFAATSYAEAVKGKLGDSDNLFYSPVSIVMALAALHVGAKASTARQIEKVLGLSETEVAKVPQEIYKFLGLIEVVEKQDDGTEKQISPLRIANALALQHNYDVEGKFIDTLKNFFRSDLSRVDFEHDTESARKAINRWISSKTAERIPELFSPGVLNDMTKLVIANAVQFEATWSHVFDEALTSDASFSLLGAGAKQSVKMMTRETTKYVYYDNEPVADWPEKPTPYANQVRVGIISLPYVRVGSEPLEMIIVLPHEQDGLTKLEALIANDTKTLDNLLEAYHTSSRSRDVNLQLPSFKFTEDFPLADVLKKLGAVDMFEARVADFTGISQPHGRQLCVGSALHRAVIDVDEKGTRAAAATAFTMMLMSMPIPEEPVNFVVDHPCLFILQASERRLPLFIGRLALPKRE